MKIVSKKTLLLRKWLASQTVRHYNRRRWHRFFLFRKRVISFDRRLSLNLLWLSHVYSQFHVAVSIISTCVSARSHSKDAMFGRFFFLHFVFYFCIADGNLFTKTKHMNHVFFISRNVDAWLVLYNINRFL